MSRPFPPSYLAEPVNIMHVRIVQVIPKATKCVDHFFSNRILVNIMFEGMIQFISKAAI